LSGISPGATVSGAFGFGTPDAVVPEEPLAPDVADAPDEVTGALPQPLTNATKQTAATPTEDDQCGRIADPGRLIPPLDPSEMRER
jgi:hypothetical protein